MCVSTLAIFGHKLNKNEKVFTHLKLWVLLATHNFQVGQKFN